MRPSTRTTSGFGWLVLCALCTACGDPPPPPAVADAAVVSDAAPPPAVTASAVPEVFADLTARADAAHVSLEGPVFGPAVPGWYRVSELAGRGPWTRPRTIDGRVGSWLDGIGGSFHFPIGANAGDMRFVEFWLRPVARGQVVSVFFDERPVTTTRLRSGWARYRFPIPGDALTPGEHSLRFWFRFTRVKHRMRTPAAFGGARVVPAGPTRALPEGWTGPLTGPGGATAQALAAEPAAEWSWYLLPPTDSRLLARVAVAHGPPVDFVVRAEADGEPPVELRRIPVTAGSDAEVDVALGGYAGRPIRLSLRTIGEPPPKPEEGAEIPSGPRAGWIEPRILMPAPTRARPRPARNVIVWVVDGLRDDRPSLGRDDAPAETPNLDLLLRDGAGAVDAWSGGASAADGHRRLLQPVDDGAHLAEVMEQTGRRTGFLSSSVAVDPALVRPFDTRLDLQRSGELTESRILLRELDAWLYVRKRDPFFLYIASADPRTPLKPAAGYRRVYDRARPLRGETRRIERLADLRDLRVAYDASVSTADYWIGQLVATLQTHGVADDTAIIIVGSVGQELREAGGLGDGHALVPEVFRVPLVAWHPHLRQTPGSAPRPLLDGGELSDVGATALGFVGAGQLAWPGRDLTGALFHALPLPPAPDHARHGNQVAARSGRWLLRGAGVRDLRLWDVDAGLDPDLELSEGHPIALRTLRDSMVDGR